MLMSLGMTEGIGYERGREAECMKIECIDSKKGISSSTSKEADFSAVPSGGIRARQVRQVEQGHVRRARCCAKLGMDIQVSS